VFDPHITYIYKTLIIRLNFHALNISVSHVNISKSTQIDQYKSTADIKDLYAGMYGFRQEGKVLSINANREFVLYGISFRKCR
jgi:transposase-like protein